VRVRDWLGRGLDIHWDHDFQEWLVGVGWLSFYMFQHGNSLFVFGSVTATVTATATATAKLSPFFASWERYQCIGAFHIGVAMNLFIDQGSTLMKDKFTRLCFLDW